MITPKHKGTEQYYTAKQKFITKNYGKTLESMVAIGVYEENLRDIYSLRESVVYQLSEAFDYMIAEHSPQD